MRRFKCETILNKIPTKIVKNFWSLKDYCQGWAVHTLCILENQNIVQLTNSVYVFVARWPSVTSSKTSTLAWNLRSARTTSNMPYCEAIISGDAPLWIKQTKKKHLHHTYDISSVLNSTTASSNILIIVSNMFSDCSSTVWEYIY